MTRQDFEVAATQSVAELRRLLDDQSKPVQVESRAVDRRGSNVGDGIPAPPELYAEPPYMHDGITVVAAASAVVGTATGRRPANVP